MYNQTNKALDRFKWQIQISLQSLNFVFSGETIVNVLDFKKDAGLWHGILTVSWAWKHFLKHFIALNDGNVWGDGWGPFTYWVNRLTLQFSGGRVGTSSVTSVRGGVGVDVDGRWPLFLLENRVYEPLPESLSFYFAECNEQAAHDQCALFCDENLPALVGAESSCSQR